MWGRTGVPFNADENRSDELPTIENARHRRVNGIDMHKLRASLAEIAGNPAQGRYRFQARNQWLDGGNTRTMVKEYDVAGRAQSPRSRPLVAASDIPTSLGGSDRAIDPLEYLLVGLAASVATSLVLHAALRGIHVDAMDTLVDGDIDLRGCLGLDPDVRPGFDDIRVSIKIDAQVSDVQLEALAALAQRLSPVLDTIARNTRVTLERGVFASWTAEYES